MALLKTLWEHFSTISFWLFVGTVMKDFLPLTKDGVFA